MTDRTKVMLLEIASVLTIFGSIAVVMVPKLDDLERRETASAVLADLDGMREAVFAFYSDSAYFPVESPSGPIPAALSAYLPVGFASRRSYGTIVYKNWPGDRQPPHPVTDSLTGAPILPAPQSVSGAPAGRGETVSASNIVGAMIIANDTKIVATAAALSPRIARFVIANRYTFLFFGT